MPELDVLAGAQVQLSRALGRARAGEDRELVQKVRERGDQLSHLLSGLVRLTRVHAPNNRAFDQPVAEFARALGSMCELLGTVHVVTVEDQVYINDIRIRTDSKITSHDLGADLRKHETGGLSFHGPLEDAAIRVLIGALGAKPEPPSPRAALTARLQQAGLSTIEVAGFFRFRTDQSAPVQRPPHEAMRRMIGLIAETWDNLAAGRALNPLPLRRAILEILDAGLHLPAFWGPFPTDAPPYAVHAAEVAVLSILMAKGAGFPQAFLQDLGVAALLHDTGYLAQIGDGAQGLMQHPLVGARIMLRQKGFHEAKVRRLRWVLEHHRDASTPGLTPGGAVLRIAEDYANAVRLYGVRALRSDFLGAMVQSAGTLYEPRLVQILVNGLGRHPPGTLLELEDGRIARVAIPARSPELWQVPVVQLLDTGSGALSEQLFDLAQGPAIRRAVPG